MLPDIKQSQDAVPGQKEGLRSKNPRERQIRALFTAPQQYSIANWSTYDVKIRQE